MEALLRLKAAPRVFRESNVTPLHLKNQRRTSSAVIAMLQAGQGHNCRQPGKLAIPGMASVSIEAGLREDKLLKALEPLKGERLLMFTDMSQAFGGFTSPTDSKR